MQRALKVFFSYIFFLATLPIVEAVAFEFPLSWFHCSFCLPLHLWTIVSYPPHAQILSTCINTIYNCHQRIISMLSLLYNESLCHVHGFQYETYSTEVITAAPALFRFSLPRNIFLLSLIIHSCPCRKNNSLPHSCIFYFLLFKCTHLSCVFWLEHIQFTFSAITDCLPI